MTQQQIKKQAQPKKAEQAEVQPKKAETEVLNDLDELLDEIDGLLEENAEQFVAAYIQKGGQ